MHWMWTIVRATIVDSWADVRVNSIIDV